MTEASAAATSGLVASASDGLPDEVASSEDNDDSLLSGLSSHSGNEGGADNEQTITPAELLDELLTAWSNEKLCPDLLPHRDDLVECVRDQLEGLERQMNQRGRVPRDLAGYLHKVEVSRIRYLVTDLLRTRLNKIQAYAEAMMPPGSANPRWAGRLSRPEADFARELVTSQHRHFDALVLAKLPQFLRPRPHPLEAPRPNMDSFVFFRVRPEPAASAAGVTAAGASASVSSLGRSGVASGLNASGANTSASASSIVRPARESEAVELKPGEQHLMQYAPIERLLLEDRVQLI